MTHLHTLADPGTMLKIKLHAWSPSKPTAGHSQQTGWFCKDVRATRTSMYGYTFIIRHYERNNK